MPRHDSRRSLSPLERKDAVQRRSRQRTGNFNCRLCQESHPLKRCPKFKRMNVSGKLKVVKRHQYCANCLAHSHKVNRCRSSDRCRQCGGRHHTLLHRYERQAVKTRIGDAAKVSIDIVFRTVTLTPTIIAKLELGEVWGNVRGILNPCEETSSVAEFLIDRYKLPVTHRNNADWAQIKIKPRFDDGPSFLVTAKVVKSLPQKHPLEKIDERVVSLYTNLRLADPNFFRNDDINFILGADIYPRLIKPNIQPGSVGTPMAQDTVLGWTIIGKFGV